MTSDVIIIGAGAAGLMAARELRRAGKTVTILESSNRVGGRAMTLDVPRAGVPVELGASFVHGDAPETTKLLDEARFAVVPVTGKQYRSENGRLAAQGPIWNRMSLVFKRMKRDRPVDRSFQDFLDEKPGGAKLEDERELARGFVRGFDAADTNLISEKSLAEQGDPTEGAAESKRIVNGYCALIDYLKHDLEGSIHLQHTARKIIWTRSHARVIDTHGTAYTARAVVVTVPLPILQDNTIAFEPEIAGMRTAARQLVMGHVLHVNLVVRERFWEDKAGNISFVHTPSRPFNVWWTQNPLIAPLITGWSGGPPAFEMTESGDVENVVLKELAKAFGMRRSRVDTIVESIHYHDWNRDRNIRGAYSYVGVGGSGAQKVLARPVDETIFLAGEATNAETSGTVEGALASGKRAARAVAEALTRS
jgi:monoamine oxidase